MALEGINKELSYLISSNCTIRLEHDKPMTLRGDKVLELTNEDQDRAFLDNRLRLVSFETDRTIDTYFNYFTLFSRVADMETSRPELTGKFISLLDLGYVPVILSPSFMSEEMYNKLMPIVRKSKVEYREHPPMRIDGRSFDSKADDVWCSRMGMAEFLNCKLTDVKPLTFLYEVMKKCL